MNTAQQGLIILLKSAVIGQRLELPEGFSLESEEVKKLITKHHVLTLAYEGAVKCGISNDTPIMKQFMASYYKLMLRSELQMRQVQRIFDAFDAHGIDYLPTKGCILKKLYRLPELRLMGDADITVRKEQRPQIAEIMTELGFEVAHEEELEYNWKNEQLYVEFHMCMRSFYNEAYYENVWDRLQKVTGNRYEFTTEDGFIHIFNHFAKHYRLGGIGLRQVMDLYVYRNAFPDMDEAFIEQEMCKLRLQHFYKNVLRMLDVWFERATTDEVVDVLSQTIFNSGSWGTLKSFHLSREATRANQTGGASNARGKSILRRIFPSKEHMRVRYKIVDKMPWLLPVLWIWRWIEALLFRRKNIQTWGRIWKSMDDDAVTDYQNRYKFVGLDHTEE